MTLRAWLLVLPAMFAIGCAVESAGSSDEEVAAGTADLSEATDTRRDPVVDAARQQRQVGEQADGYLGVVTDPAVKAVTETEPLDALEDHVAHVNIQRRALYTDVATRNHVTVSEVGRAVACILFRDRVAVGQAYRTEDERWAIHSEDAPVETPSFCQR